MQDKLRTMLKSGKLTYLLVAICVLAALILFLLPDNDKKSSAPAEIVEAQGAEGAREYADALTEQVKQMVSAITGEPSPHVTVTLETMGETVYATENRKTEKNAEEYDGEALNRIQTDGDTERTYIVVKDSDGAERPLIVTQSEPEIRGVVIVSNRGNDAVIRERITQAVKTMLNLSSTQVCVTGQA